MALFPLLALTDEVLQICVCVPNMSKNKGRGSAESDFTLPTPDGCCRGACLPI